MPYTAEIVAELRLLTHYNLDTSQEGIKVHSSADPEMIAAAQRLYDKGLVSQADGGYLTNLGRTAAEHAQNALRILDVELPNQ
ncbi:MAG: TIGR02647 family protein [Pseudomonadota bacterium]